MIFYLFEGLHGEEHGFHEICRQFDGVLVLLIIKMYTFKKNTL